MDFDFLTDVPLPFAADELETARQLPRPLVHARRAAKREFISGLKKEALNQLIPTLPPPDVDLYVVSNGSGAEIRHGTNPLAFDFGTYLGHVVRMLGDQGCTAYISSWTMSETHIKNMIEMLADGRLTALSVLADPYFSRRTPALYAQLVTGLGQHGGRYLAFKNHVKAMCISNPAGDCCTITGSANLSAQPRCEQYVLTTCPAVYAFFVSQFFEVMLTNAKTKEG